MASGVDAVLVRTPFEDFFVRVERGGAQPTDVQIDAAKLLTRELRLGIEQGDPQAIAAAQQLDRALQGGAFLFSPVDAVTRLDLSLNGLPARLEQALLVGRLVVDRNRPPSLSDRRTFDLPELPPLPPAPREGSTRTFEVRFVDEVGKAITGIDAEFTADGAQTRSTNAAGIALLDDVVSSSANVSILDPEALSKVLDPRWENFRPGTPPRESNTNEVVFRGGALGPFDLKPEVPNTVVIKPPLGKLFVELWDKTGRVRHANRSYQITGPQTFEGTTDEDGRLLHEDVFPGDYGLSLALEFFEEEAPDRSIDVVDSPLVVLEPSDAEPQVRMLGVLPRSVLAQLHMFFNTNKAFLLPTALPSVQELRQLYQRNAPCRLLVVGHCDTTADAAYNDKLSLERAKATIAYLKDDIEGWFKYYGDDNHPKQRWGKVEDHLMIVAVPGFGTKPRGEDPIRWYQRTRGLEVDGVAGKETRHALIEEYMSLDGASLQDFVGIIEATPHGCGENFPLDDTGEELDAAPADAKRDPIDRRVELFFFDDEFGITPVPPGPNSAPRSPEYPLWRKRVSEMVELKPGALAGPKVTFIELTDAHFRTNSAVVLPEGEAPDATGEHPGLTSASVIGMALRFNQEHAGRTVFIAGHTDTVADPDFNQLLSEERARVALALLKGDPASRESFKDLCNNRHKIADINQILSWVAREFADFDKPKFACDPGRVDDVAKPAAVSRFQEAFNAHKTTLGSSAPNLLVDGKVGKETWGAFFDCYDFALRRELGEDPTTLADLRSKLTFTDPSREALGFGEHFPIEELGVDNFQSQTNRRVEILFFEQGEEPDLQHAKEDPETSELYLPGHFERTPLTVNKEDLVFGHIDVHLHVPLNASSAEGAYRLFATNVVFDSTVPATAATREDGDFLAVRFSRMDRKGVYSLEQIVGQARLSIFDQLPFDRLIGISRQSRSAALVAPRPVDVTDFDQYNLSEALDIQD